MNKKLKKIKMTGSRSCFLAKLALKNRNPGTIKELFRNYFILKYKPANINRFPVLLGGNYHRKVTMPWNKSALLRICLRLLQVLGLVLFYINYKRWGYVPGHFKDVRGMKKLFRKIFRIV